MKKLQVFGCLFMAILFGYSASVQLDDIDWYFWLPLYTFASLISLVHTVTSTMSKASRSFALATLLFGLALFIKVSREAYGLGMLWSLDMEQRVVREKLGSLLVVIGMALQVELMADHTHISSKLPASLGMWFFLVFSTGLCAAYFYPRL